VRTVVIGGGSWGTAVARLLARAGHRTTLACRDPAQAETIGRRHRNPRYLYDIELPPELDASPIADTSFDGAELVALAVPSRAFAATVASVADRLPGCCR
jgi:glycerol-3-phosphate dehydrogenase (NAD(P)+)